MPTIHMFHNVFAKTELIINVEAAKISAEQYGR